MQGQRFQVDLSWSSIMQTLVLLSLAYIFYEMLPVLQLMLAINSFTNAWVVLQNLILFQIGAASWVAVLISVRNGNWAVIGLAVLFASAYTASYIQALRD